MQELFVTEEELKELAEQMSKKNQAFLQDRQFYIHAEKTDNSVFVTVTLKNKDESYFYPVELRMNFEQEELIARKGALHLVDYADLYFEDFLTEGESLYLQIDWAKHEYDTVEFEMRGQVRNKKLESMADEILAQADQTNPTTV